MEAAFSSEKLVPIDQPRLRYIPENSDLHHHRWMYAKELPRVRLYSMVIVIAAYLKVAFCCRVHREHQI
jgi:hypothetical protein